MTHAYLEDLLALGEAQFQHEQARMQIILAEEADIRAALSQLEHSRRRARDAPATELLAQRHFGGDVLWQGWVMRMRRDLQIRLAQVLARKGAMVRELARAHSRKAATEELLQEARNARHTARQKAENEVLQGLFVLRSSLEEDRP